MCVYICCATVRGAATSAYGARDGRLKKIKITTAAESCAEFNFDRLNVNYLNLVKTIDWPGLRRPFIRTNC